jgi:hypothetical protein
MMHQATKVSGGCLCGTVRTKQTPGVFFKAQALGGEIDDRGHGGSTWSRMGIK